MAHKLTETNLGNVSSKIADGDKRNVNFSCIIQNLKSIDR